MLLPTLGAGASSSGHPQYPVRSDTVPYLGTESSKLLFTVTPIIRALLIKGSVTHCQTPESKLIIAVKTEILHQEKKIIGRLGRNTAYLVPQQSNGIISDLGCCRSLAEINMLSSNLALKIGRTRYNCNPEHTVLTAEN